MSYKKKYKSIYGAVGLVTAPNHLAELIIKKRADKKGLKIPNQIWSPKFKDKTSPYKYWYNAYFGELVHAASILKKYDEDCVIEAFHHHECLLILSLRNAKLTRISNELQQKKNLFESTKEKNKLNIVSANTLPRKTAGQKSKLGKLK